MVDNLEISESAKQRLNTQLEAFDDIEGQKTDAITNAHKNYEQQTAAQRAAAQEQDARRAAGERRAFDSTWNSLSKDIPSLKPVEGSDAHITRAAQVRATAEKILLSNDNSIEDMSAAAIKAGAYDLLAEDFATLKKAHEAMVAENGRLSAVSPSMQVSGQRANGNGNGADLSRMTVEERARYMWENR